MNKIAPFFLGLSVASLLWFEGIQIWYHTGDYLIGLMFLPAIVACAVSILIEE